MSKKCLNCGAELPDNASFCPSCTHVQNVRLEITPPRRWWKKAIFFLSSVTAITLTILLMTLYNEPTQVIRSPEPSYSGGAGTSARRPQVSPSDKPDAIEISPQATYSDADGTYELFLTFDENGETAMAEINPTIPRGTLTSRLVIRKNGKDIPSSLFASKIERGTASTTSLDGAPRMTISEPLFIHDAPSTILFSDVHFEPDCGTNEINWTLYMKNGVTLNLQHRISIPNPKRLEYHFEDAPMGDIEALRALIKTIKEEIDPDTLVSLYLPPVVYDGGLELNTRAITFYGSTSGKVTTTFTGPTTVATEEPTLTKFYNVQFVGNGEVGISATASLSLYGCTFSGWDTAVFSGDGSWVSASGCIFDDNDIGLCFNTQNASTFNSYNGNNYFLNNGTGLLIKNIPDVSQLNFSGSYFSGNSVDIQKPDEVQINTYASTFE